MRTFAALSATLIAGLSTGANAACDYPPLVIIPAEEDMEGREQEVMQDLQTYFQGMQEYVGCIMEELNSEELTPSGESAAQLYQSVLVQRNNMAVAEAEAVQRWLDARFPEAAAPAED